MDEHVLIADGRLDEPITLGRVEPLDGTLRHRLSPALDIKKTRPRYSRATPQAASGSLLNFLVAKRTVERPKSDCSDIATRNLRVSKLSAGTGNGMAMRSPPATCGSGTTMS